MRNHAHLVVRLPRPASQGDGDFQWIVDPTMHPEADNATWYCDGSLLFGKWAPLRATGFAIAVVAPDGSLLGFGMGKPPHWCRTAAAAAEAWAIHIVLSFTIDIPQIRTDCQSLLATATSGTQQATDASRPLARIWKHIADRLDGSVSILTTSGKLVWMPAHQTFHMIGQKRLSNGAKLTSVDWRSNRLVDLLAKIAAPRGTDAVEAIKFLESAQAALKHAAELLGRVTHAANNFEVVTIDELGARHTTIKRDAMQAPRTYLQAPVRNPTSWTRP